MSGKRRRNPLPLILILILLPALGFMGWKIWSILQQSQSEGDKFRQLAALVSEEEGADLFGDIADATVTAEGKAAPTETAFVTGKIKTEISERVETDAVSTETAASQAGKKGNTDSEEMMDGTEPAAVTASSMKGEAEQVEASDESVKNNAEVLSAPGDAKADNEPVITSEESFSEDDLLSIPEETAAPEREILPQYQKLHEMNSDFFGWVRIEGTNIDYPVMYSPEDPEFYLHRDFEKQESYSGTPFLEGNCAPEGNYYIIYAHHMKDESMFHTLPNYEKEEYWQAHPLIQLDTLYERRTYQVIAAFRSKVYDPAVKGRFKYYEYTDLRDPAIFEEYMDGVRSLALYDTGLDAAYGEEILALSTCNYHTENGRFVVVAKRMEEEREE